tara:strand:- start:115 stop:774 length:660 start_codon:yes stop_codon:yes gene_type:complete
MDNPVAAGAIILAGGASSRMGETKSIVEINGKTMLQLVIESLTKSGFKSVILSLKNKEQWEEITNSMTIKKKSPEFFQIDNTTLPFQVCFDSSIPNKPNSPIIGLISSIEKALDNGWKTVQVTPCDVPYLSPELPQLLFSKLSGQFDCVVAHSNSGIEPLLFCSKTKTLNEVLGMEVYSARQVITNLNSYEVKPDEWLINGITNQCFTNVNTLEDIEIQ